MHTKGLNFEVKLIVFDEDKMNINDTVNNLCINIANSHYMQDRIGIRHAKHYSKKKVMQKNDLSGTGHILYELGLF